MMKPVSVAIVGAGNVARTTHMPIWQKMKHVKVVAVCDLNKNLAEKLAKDYNVPRTYGSFEELLENEELPLVMDICTPPSTHAHLGIEAMKNGCHVLLEKPMAMSVEDCERIFKEYQRRKDEVKFCVIHSFLFDPPIIEVRKLAREDEILGMEIHMLHTPEDEMLSNPSHWTHSLPAGRFGENLIHPIYTMRNLFGSLELRDVYVSKRGAYDWVKFDELWATFASNDGKYGLIHVSFNSPRWTADFSLNIYGMKSIIKYDGSNFTLVRQGPLMKGFIYHGKIPKLKVALDCLNFGLQSIKAPFNIFSKILAKRWKCGHEVLFSIFIDSIINNAEVPYTPEEAFEATRVFLETLDTIEKRV
jgi:predicted dehydrogenase